MKAGSARGQTAGQTGLSTPLVSPALATSIGSGCEALAPFLRVLGAMEDGVDSDLIVKRLVENFEWESTDGRSPKFIKGDRIHLWLALNAEGARLDAAEEVFAQARFPISRTSDTILRHRPPLRARKRRTQSFAVRAFSFT